MGFAHACVCCVCVCVCVGAMVGVSVAGGMGSLAAPIVMPDTGGLEGLRTLLLHGRATLGTMLTMAQFMMVRGSCV